jgi:hypothetical protein
MWDVQEREGIVNSEEAEGLTLERKKKKKVEEKKKMMMMISLGKILKNIYV